MRIAVCVICHKFSPVLAASVRYFSGFSDVYIHVDAKSDLSKFIFPGNVTLLEARHKTNWGTYSLVECTLELFRATLNQSYDRICLISGDTLPLWEPEHIVRFFRDNHDKEFVYTINTTPSHKRRVRYIHPTDDVFQRTALEKKVHALRRRMGLYPRNKLYGSLPELRSGGQWISVTSRFRDYIFEYLDKNPWYGTAFRYSLCPDEHFFQTLIGDSPYRDKRDARRFFYVDWHTGPAFPRMLDNTDHSRLLEAKRQDTMTEHYLFARKFTDGLDIERYFSEVVNYEL